MIPALVVYVLAAVPAFILCEGVMPTPMALIAAALWPLWPIAVAKDELSIWLAVRAYDRDRKRAARGGR